LRELEGIGVVGAIDAVYFEIFDLVTSKREPAI
jgi:hypothetical protein